MMKIGVWMMILGAGSFGLNMVGMEFKLLMWIDLWGESIGHGIRIAMIAIGGVLAVIGRGAASST